MSPPTLEEVTLERLHRGMKDLGLEVKGDGDYVQMVETILLMFSGHHRSEVKLTTEIARLRRMEEAARLVVRATESFRSSLPYQPREAVYDLYREKLAVPLDALHAALAEGEQ